MRIITTRKLRFYTKDRKESFVTEGSNIIQDCPDWAMDDDMFKAAKSSGQLQILSTTKELKQAENEGGLAKNSHEAKQYLHRNDPEQSEDEEADEEGSEDEEADEGSEDESQETVDAQKAAKAAKRAARRAAKKAAKEAQE